MVQARLLLEDPALEGRIVSEWSTLLPAKLQEFGESERELSDLFERLRSGGLPRFGAGACLRSPAHHSIHLQPIALEIPSPLSLFQERVDERSCRELDAAPAALPRRH